MSDLIKNIQQQFGAEALLDMFTGGPKVETISTGIPTVDHVLGGGVPKGRFIEIYGPESSGKTTLALSIMAQTEGQVGMIDAEHSFNPVWAQKLGLDPDRLLLCQPNCGEQGLSVAGALAESGEVPVVLIDSVAALVPKAELMGGFGEAHIGLQARLMGQAMRKLCPVCAHSGCTMLWINQLRYKVGVIWGSPETTSGGNALKFYASQRIDLRKGKKEEASQEVKVKVPKNKTGTPFRSTTFDIYFERGIGKEENLIDLCVELGTIEKAGAWFRYGEIKLGQGKIKSAMFLRDNPELVIELKDKI